MKKLIPFILLGTLLIGAGCSEEPGKATEEDKKNIQRLGTEGLVPPGAGENPDKPKSVGEPVEGA